MSAARQGLSGTSTGLQTTMTNWSRSLGIRPTRGRREGRIVEAAVVVEGEKEDGRLPERPRLRAEVERELNSERRRRAALVHDSRRCSRLGSLCMRISILSILARAPNPRRKGANRLHVPRASSHLVTLARSRPSSSIPARPTTFWNVRSL